MTDVTLVAERIKLDQEIRGHSETDILYTKTNHIESNIKIIVVPGNPGVVDFYYDFIKHLYSNLKLDIIAVSHLGHCGKIQESFSVEEQIEHKALFLDWLLKYRFNDQKDIKFVLIGHSVGSYVSLKVLKRYGDKYPIQTVCNLFPTFRNLYEGLSPFIKMVVMRSSTRSAISSFLHYIPSMVTNAVLGFILPTDEVRIAISQKINYYLALNILYMAYTETEDIRELDQECKSVFQQNLDSLLFIYGTSDPYTPHQFYHDMKSDYPTGNIEFAQEGIPHAFVLNHSKPIAIRVSEFILNSTSMFFIDMTSTHIDLYNNEANNEMIVNSNNSSNNNNDNNNLFLKCIWRNKYIKSNIKRQVFNGKVITVHLPFLLENYKSLTNIPHLRLKVYRHHYVEYASEFINNQQARDLVYELKFDRLFQFGNIKNPSLDSFIPNGVRILKLGRSFNMPLHSLFNTETNFDHLEYLCLGDKFNQSIQHPLPPTITTLVLGDDFNAPIKYLPKSLCNLTIGNGCRDFEIDNSIVPSTLKRLVVGQAWENFKNFKEIQQFECTLAPIVYEEDQQQPNFVLPFNCTTCNLKSVENFTGLIFPPTLSTVHLELIMMNPIPAGLFPETIHSFYLKSSTFSPLLPGSLPSSLTLLDLGVKFNQPLTEGILPKNLLWLRLSDTFNQRIEVGALPRSLKTLIVSGSYGLPMPLGAIPHGVKHLTFNHSCFPPPLMGLIPNTVEDLVFSEKFSAKMSPGFIPKSVKRLSMSLFLNKGLQVGFIPNSVESLKLNCDPFLGSIQKGSIPSSVTDLQISGLFSCRFVRKYHIPSTVKKMQFQMEIGKNEIVDPKSSPLPHGITHLIVRSTHPIPPHSVPSSVEKMTFYHIPQPIDLGVIPNSVTTLEFTRGFDQPLKVGVFPNSVINISFSLSFTQFLAKGVIPNSVRNLKICSRYVAIEEGTIPSSVRSLTIPSNDYHGNQKFIPKSVIEINWVK
ncbi:hypothetical protein CYY_006336 [Polysphondylium violaceum]|uniref:Uncharacterized protein n=1 Tax=Polysphondylium violaceum TaxID=133409 RepID=A0A8J4Q072_9MYCE|nr:hypothetical protein CYY_006336 [Polysphondylium violaceum]